MSNSLGMAIVGLIGIAFGAWLNSVLANNRERWALKRQLYSQLLESLGELIHTTDMQIALLHRHGTSSDDEALSKRERELAVKDAIDQEQFRKTLSVAAIMLPAASLNTLDAMRKHWDAASQADSYDEHLDMYRSSTKKAYDSLIEAARRDLRIKPL